ncbi:MAG TPA: chemoreceptor glutamine deamidase CheD [Candidatus Acidoferrum sp.]|nr:chemoreceptor glutamine deamidase CheD [Candidatus Acidoferrum sp.]
MRNSGTSFAHIKKYYDKVNNCETAKILPGEFYVTDNQEMITTVLGSCVSACIYDPCSGLGGMNHFMLPGNEAASDAEGSTRYGLFAMESLVNEILKRGSPKKSLKAKLFGGGQIIENMSDVGQKNIRFAKKFLFAEGIPLESHDLGLIYPRKVNFFPHSGRVLVKRLQSLHNNTIEQREKEYMQSLNTAPISGDIDLF